MPATDLAVLSWWILSTFCLSFVLLNHSSLFSILSISEAESIFSPFTVRALYDRDTEMRTLKGILVPNSKEIQQLKCM